MNNPCEKCKRTECPKVCYPAKDFTAALAKIARATGKQNAVWRELCVMSATQEAKKKERRKND